MASVIVRRTTVKMDVVGREASERERELSLCSLALIQLELAKS